MDTSIYDNEKAEILELLQSCEKIEKVNCVLFLIDEATHHKLLESQKLLELEYGYDDDILKRYSLDTIVYHLNKEMHTYTYSLYEKTFWRQINEPEKVKKRLDAEFAIWKNRLLLEVTSKMKSKGATAEHIKDKKIELHREIAEGEKELQYIKDNWDELEVKISSFFSSPSLGVVIRFRVGVHSKKLRLKSSIPNVLYLEQKDEDKPLPHNKLHDFLEDATNAFGDVFYKKN